MGASASTCATPEPPPTKPAVEATPLVVDVEKASKPAAEATWLALQSARLFVTIEAATSKLFLAGFCWQLSSVLADSAFGFDSDSVGFAFTTGVGDAFGVLAGHSALLLSFKLLVPMYHFDKETIPAFALAGLWLAQAAFCSGTAWQPAVNLFHDIAGLSFTLVLLLTGLLTGLAFYVGLTLGRVLYRALGLIDNAGKRGLAEAAGSSWLSFVRPDALLSLSVGGGTALFVATDGSFGEQNWASVFVVADDDSPLMGATKAGATTMIGFAVAQLVQNLVLPRGIAWLDGEGFITFYPK